MSDQQGHAATPELAPEQWAKTKRPYKKPSFREERAFETMALTCGKVTGGTQGQCQTSPKNS